mgnify:CR=1 FL=1
MPVPARKLGGWNMIALPTGSKETLNKRKRNAKHYVCAKGLYHCVTSPVALHYLDEQNCLCDVDVFIPEDLKITKAEHRTDFFPAEISAHYRSRKGGDVFVRLSEIDGIQVENLNLKTKPTRAGNVLKWIDVLPELDIECRVEPSGIEFFKILKGPSAPVSFSWEYRENNPEGTIKIREKAEGWDSRIVPKGKNKSRVIKRDIQINVEVTRENGLMTRRETFTGKVKVKDPKTRQRKWVEESLNYPIVIDATISENITAGADDVQENHVLVSGSTITSATLATGGTKIRMGQGSYTSGGPTGWRMQAGGFRFQTIGVPAGSTINSAVLKLFKAASNGTSQAYNVYADEVDDAAAWSAENVPSSISKFPGAGVALNLNSDFGSPGATFSAGMTAAVQQILNRSGWLGGQDMRFFCNPVYSVVSSGTYVDVWSFEKTTNIPLLSITYTPPLKTSQTVWNALALTVQPTQALWNLANPVTQSRSLPWNIYINIDAPKTSQIVWDVSGTAGNSLNAIWDQISVGEASQGMAFIHNPTRPAINPKDKTFDLKGRKMIISLGDMKAQVVSVKRVGLAEIKATTGKLYAVGIESREKQPDIPANPDDDAILLTLQLLMED